MTNFDLNFPIDTSSISAYFPQFESKYGSNVPMNITVSYANTEVQFGINKEDIIFTSSISLNFQLANSSQSLLQLTLPIYGALDMDIINEDVYILMHDLSL